MYNLMEESKSFKRLLHSSPEREGEENEREKEENEDRKKVDWDGEERACSLS